MKRIPLLFSFVIFLSLISPASQAEEKADIRLYRLDCGNILVTELSVFSDTDRYVGEQKEFTSSCYLIKHNDSWMLWDTGLEAEIGSKPEGITNEPFTLTVPTSLISQLTLLGLKPENITHVGISHAHFDHSGNVSMFKNAQLVIQKNEYDILAQGTEVASQYHFDASMFEHFLKDENKGQVNAISGDFDVFGDGSVKTISLPGHTPGHMALKVTLPNSGVVILTGDQWHFDDNRLYNGVPTLNHDRSDTLASSDRLEKIIANNRALVIIQHERDHIDHIPSLPKYLD